MTHDEMRRRLAEAMGWTDLYDSAYGMLWGTEPATDIGYDAPRRVGIEVPDPLESDRDAALLRAWCLEQGWAVDTRAMRPTDGDDGLGGRAWCRVTVRHYPEHIEGQHWAWQGEEPDPCRRERLALCRAVLQVIEATEVRDAE